MWLWWWIFDIRPEIGPLQSDTIQTGEKHYLFKRRQKNKNNTKKEESTQTTSFCNFDLNSLPGLDDPESHRWMAVGLCCRLKFQNLFDTRQSNSSKSQPVYLYIRLFFLRKCYFSISSFYICHFICCFKLSLYSLSILLCLRHYIFYKMEQTTIKIKKKGKYASRETASHNPTSAFLCICRLHHSSHRSAHFSCTAQKRSNSTNYASQRHPLSTRPSKSTLSLSLDSSTLEFTSSIHPQPFIPSRTPEPGRSGLCVFVAIHVNVSIDQIHKFHSIIPFIKIFTLVFLEKILHHTETVRLR